MKYLDEYRDSDVATRLARKILKHAPRGVRLMEFCGGHTVSIMKYGLRQLLSPKVELLSGPGCPVCVTATSDLDKVIAAAQQPGVIVATFGDMLKVPGSFSSLQKARAEGGDVRVVYSAQDALEIAQNNPHKSVIFIGIGFETTAPTIAVSLMEAEKRCLRNYYVLSLHKLCPPVMKALLDSGETNLDGIVCPGHVSAILGSHAYEFISRDYGIACAIAGFEPLDILLAVHMLVNQIEEQQPRVEIAYRRGVKPEGNRNALAIMNTVFESTEATWRGMGTIANSGLRLKERFRAFDAEDTFEIKVPNTREPEACICGAILRGAKTPLNCSSFGTSCTPDSPVGPCMVSSEGSCAAFYHYGIINGR